MAERPATKGNARRKLILETARKLFVEKGYAGTSLGDVIAVTGGSRRNFYTEFGGKQGLLHAVIEDITSDIAAGAEISPDPEMAPRDWLIAVGTRFARLMLSPEITAVLREFVAQGGAAQDRLDAMWRAGPGRFHTYLEHWLAEQDRLGRLRVSNPSATARILPEMMRGHFQIELLVGRRAVVSDDEITHHVETAVDLALEGLKPAKSQS